MALRNGIIISVVLTSCVVSLLFQFCARGEESHTPLAQAPSPNHFPSPITTLPTSHSAPVTPIMTRASLVTASSVRCQVSPTPPPTATAPPGLAPFRSPLSTFASDGKMGSYDTVSESESESDEPERPHTHPDTHTTPVDPSYLAGS